MSTAWGRIFHQYGPYEHPDRLVASVIRQLLGGKVAECTHGRQIRNFLHVADVGSAFAALLDSAVEGPVNIGSQDRLVLAELIGLIAKRIGRPDLIRLGSRPASPGEPAVLAPDVGRLYDEVGWRPSFSLEDGLAETIAWWQRDSL
jgi:nucleoside-diphosphate-sugar epimerase